MFNNYVFYVAMFLYFMYIGPPEITGISPNMSYLEGTKSSLVCNATNNADATNEVQVAWFYKNLTSLYPIVQDSHVIIHNVKNLISRQIHSILLFDPVSRIDEGVYICKASNHPQSSTKRSTEVMIKSKWMYIFNNIICVCTFLKYIRFYILPSYIPKCSIHTWIMFTNLKHSYWWIPWRNN